MSDPFLPKFVHVDDHWEVHLAGRKWWLMSMPQLAPRGAPFARWDGKVVGSIFDLASVRFEVALIPDPPDLSIPDHIVLGEN